jgi:hypothetical protein
MIICPILVDQLPQVCPICMIGWICAEWWVEAELGGMRECARPAGATRGLPPGTRETADGEAPAAEAMSFMETAILGSLLTDRRTVADHNDTTILPLPSAPVKATEALVQGRSGR